MSQSGIQHARVRRALSLALLSASSWVMPQCIRPERRHPASMVQ